MSDTEPTPAAAAAATTAPEADVNSIEQPMDVEPAPVAEIETETTEAPAEEITSPKGQKRSAPEDVTAPDPEDAAEPPKKVQKTEACDDATTGNVTEATTKDAEAAAATVQEPALAG